MASVTDGIFTTGSSIELTTGWTIGGMYEHHWTPDWKTSVYGGYVKITYDDTAAQMYCGYSSSAPRGSASTSSGALGGIVSSCDPNTDYLVGGHADAVEPELEPRSRRRLHVEPPGHGQLRHRFAAGPGRPSGDGRRYFGCTELHLVQHLEL